MSIKYLNLSGLEDLWINIKNYILSKIPTKTSELTNDSGYLTSHQSLDNYVTLNSEQTITGKKLFTNSTTKVNSVNTFIDSTLFIDTSASVPRGSFPETAYRVGRVYIGDGTSYNGSWFIIDPIIDTNKAYYRMVTTNPDNTDSTRFSITWDSTKEGVRRRKNVSQGDLLPSENNIYNLGADDLKWDIGYIHNLIGSNKENASEDANNYYSTTSGSHMTFYTTTNGGTKLSNVPAAVNTQLESRTIRYLSSSDWNVEQICHNTNGLYYRKGNNNGWGDWKTFAFTDSSITGTASNVTGTVAIANGGTGATTRLNAVKALTNEAVGTPTHFLAITTNWGKAGYTTVAQAKTVLGITGDIVSHNASEFLTSHQSLSSCVKNNVTNNQTIKSTGITRGTAPSSEQTFGIAFSDKNNKYIGNIYGLYAPNKAIFVGLYAYKGTTTSNGDNASVRVGYDASGNAYTYAPTPATSDNSTQIATTAFVKAQGYITGSGNTTGSSGSCTGNAATASKVVATVANDNTGALVQGTMGSNDCFRIAIGGAANAGWAEIATGDDANEPIYVRQYKGNFTTLQRTATLLDGSGNTSFPGTVTATGFSGPLTGNVTGNCSGSSGSCTGNASTATQFSANTTVALTGDATGTSAGSKKGWSVPVTLANSGVTAGSYGPSANASPSHGGTFSVPYVTVDAKGRITAASTKTITLPSDNNTDTKVTQTVTTGNAYYPAILGNTATATATETSGARFSKGFLVNTRYSTLVLKNTYDSANTKGVRNTATYQNGCIIAQCYDGAEMGRIHCESSKNGYQQTYMQARSYIKNGAISPEGTATTCYITVRVRDNGSKTIYTDGSWENSLTPYANNTYSLGTSSLRWKNAYINNLILNGAAFDPTSIDGIGTVKLLAYLPTSSQEYSMNAGTIKAGSNLGEVWAFHTSSDSVAYLNSSMSTTQSGTWKLLNYVSVGGNPTGCKVIGLWVRIA